MKYKIYIFLIFLFIYSLIEAHPSLIVLTGASFSGKSSLAYILRDYPSVSYESFDKSYADMLKEFLQSTHSQKLKELSPYLSENQTIFSISAYSKGILRLNHLDDDTWAQVKPKLALLKSSLESQKFSSQSHIDYTLEKISKLLNKNEIVLLEGNTIPIKQIQEKFDPQLITWVLVYTPFSKLQQHIDRRMNHKDPSKRGCRSIALYDFSKYYKKASPEEQFLEYIDIKEFMKEILISYQENPLHIEQVYGSFEDYKIALLKKLGYEKGDRKIAICPSGYLPYDIVINTETISFEEAAKQIYEAHLDRLTKN